ncbi:MAG: hypothetical protein QXW58_07640, partial [Thermosphaera sp.]
MWDKKLEDFIYWKDSTGKHIVDMKYLLQIASIYPNLIPRKKMEPRDNYSKKRWELFQDIDNNIGKNEELARNSFMRFMETIVSQTVEQGYSSFTWPTIIQEPNLHLREEKTPTEQEVWRVLFLTYSSVKIGNSLV